ncbi:MAG: hypothetical protein ABMA64_12515 [Myxococcota bacterium]
MITLWIGVSSFAVECDDLKLSPSPKVDTKSYDKGKSDFDVFLGGAGGVKPEGAWCTWDAAKNEFTNATEETKTPILKPSADPNAVRPCEGSGPPLRPTYRTNLNPTAELSCLWTDGAFELANTDASGWAAEAFTGQLLSPPCSGLSPMESPRVDDGMWSATSNKSVFLSGADGTTEPVGWCTWSGRWKNGEALYVPATKDSERAIWKPSEPSAKKPCAGRNLSKPLTPSYSTVEGTKPMCLVEPHAGVRIAWKGEVGWVVDAFSDSAISPVPSTPTWSKDNLGVCPILASWGPACHEKDPSDLEKLVAKRYGSNWTCTRSCSTFECNVVRKHKEGVQAPEGQGGVSVVTVQMGDKGRYRRSVCAAPARIISEKP